MGNTCTVLRGFGLRKEGEVVTHSSLRSYWPPPRILSLIRRGLSAEFDLLMGLVREMRGTLLPPALSGGTLLYLRSTASTDLAGDAEPAVSGELLLLLVLVTSFFCEAACSTTFRILTGGLIPPFWHRHRARGHHPASSTSSASRTRGLKQWLSSPCRNERNSRPCRSTRVSQNRAPPQIPPLSTYIYI